jgi:8-oxo-dGTP diphosphatase
MDNIHPTSVAAVVFSLDRNQVLLVERRDVPVWVLPGGGIDLGERSEDAVIREILEETGFTVKVERLVGLYIPVNSLSKPTHLYECSLVTGHPKTSSETKKVRFFPLSSLPQKIPPPFRGWIEDAHQVGPFVVKKLTDVNYRRFFFYLLSHPILVIRFLLARMGLPFNT